MVLAATVVATIALGVLYLFWTLSRVIDDGAKSKQIFFLTMVTGICLVTNVIGPFVFAALLIAALELRAFVFATVSAA